MYSFLLLRIVICTFFKLLEFILTGCNDAASVQKLENHLALLKEEYTKLQRSYAELERKFNEVVASSADAELTGELSSFVSRLALTVASLYGRTTYSDVNIRTSAKTVPAHKFVLHARSEKWRDDVLGSTQELDWSDLDEDVVMALLRWIYTDLIDLQHDRLALDLLKAAHRFGLPALLGLCERALVASVGVRSCVRFYCVAEEVAASTLLEYCSGIISTHWDDLTAQDFEHMSGPLLFKMLKNKTKYPLHAAVRLLREDVVFLCLVENDDALVNSLSEQGQLPLQMALSAKNSQIAQTLVKNGRANVNAYDAKGSTLLIDALKKGDVFSAKFLLDQNCILDLISRPSADTVLHIICSYVESQTDRETFEQINELGKNILQRKANVNIQNVRGETPLHVAIASQNTIMLSQLLDVPNIDINMCTFDEKCALELCLTLDDVDYKLAHKLLKMGARPNPIKSATGDSLLQILAIGGQRFEEAAIFLADFANLDHLNFTGLSALHIAASQNMSNLVKKLLTNGAPCNLQTTETGMKSALHMAVEANAVGAIEAFAQVEVNGTEVPDFNCKDINGDTPLSLCLSLNKTHLVSILIKGGADVNARNRDDFTLLHQSILNSDSDTALFLIENGADINAVAVHYQKIIHADIKPGNLLLTECGHIKIADLGVCNEFLGEDAIMSNGSTGGTPAFRAPETLILGQNVYCGRASDVWALGATLYSLIFGNVPFLADSIPLLYERIQQDPVVFPQKLTVSENLKRCILHMLEKNATQRITVPELKINDWVTTSGVYPLPTEEENCCLVQVDEEDINSVVRSIPKLDTLILIKTMLKKHSFGNPFIKGVSGKALQPGGSRLERFVRAGRSNSAPGSYQMSVDRQPSTESLLPSLTEHSTSKISEDT
ncbi:GL12350 [Drosophila persimilis]|uniref:GL12350 n=1 Tax=Drosophila persimilis TaxID=7234 RepID=B4GM98_DROPE|nr:GL12350 [Drosophila persimilis]